VQLKAHLQCSLQLGSGRCCDCRECVYIDACEEDTCNHREAGQGVALGSECSALFTAYTNNRHMTSATHRYRPQLDQENCNQSCWKVCRSSPTMQPDKVGDEVSQSDRLLRWALFDVATVVLGPVQAGGSRHSPVAAPQCIIPGHATMPTLEP
jgi:hypothetical protein